MPVQGMLVRSSGVANALVKYAERPATTGKTYLPYLVGSRAQEGEKVSVAGLVEARS